MNRRKRTIGISLLLLLLLIVPSFWGTYREYKRLDHALIEAIKLRHPGKNEEQEPRPALLLLYAQASCIAATSDNWGSGPDGTLIRALLDHGAKVNDRMQSGCSPLLIACMFSNRDTVRLLLERGADPNLANEDGTMPLEFADAEETKLLLDHGANIEAVDHDKQTALIYAAVCGNADKIRTLLEHRANIEALDKDGKTPLITAAAA